MCRRPKSRKGSRFEHGLAHAHDHEAWSRRQFLSTMGLATGGLTLAGSAHPLRAFGNNSLLGSVSGAPGDRVLVLVQMEGGNDGLNTLVPFRDDRYYQARPNLSISDRDVLRLTDEVGLHPAMESLAARFGDGQMAIVQGVGYPEPDRSHFRSTDIWVSASDANVFERSGWGGRALEAIFPQYIDALPTSPVGVQLGGASMMFRGRDANLGMIVSGGLSDLDAGAPSYDIADVPATTYGGEMAFVREVANSSFRYSGAVQAALNSAQNTVQYPESEFGEQLASVARFIRGGLGSKIYHVSLAGFDTHSEQAERHPQLLGQLSQGVDALLRDLESDGLAENVLVMTFSEFGRTIWENGSGGTDHATVAPHFLIGGGVSGGLFGAAPDFGTTDDYGDLPYQVDFRSLYTTVLDGWFDLGMAPSVVAGSFDPLPLFGEATSRQGDPSLPREASLESIFPNPASDRAEIRIRMNQSQGISLTLIDARGGEVQNIMEGTLSLGVHGVSIRLSGLAAGTYFIRLRVGGRQQVRSVVVAR